MPSFPPDDKLPDQFGGTSAGDSSHACRILVVDDQPDIVTSLTTLLRVLGYDVRSADDGPTALQAAEEFRPDVLFLDLGLPTLDGYEVCRRIRRSQWGQRAVVAALTGFTEERDRRRSAAVGFDFHLGKPLLDAVGVVSGLSLLAETRKQVGR